MAKEAEKKKRVESRRNQVGKTRAAGATDDQIEDALLKPKKNVDEYFKVFNQNTEFFSTYNPDMIEEALLEFLRK